MRLPAAIGGAVQKAVAPALCALLLGSGALAPQDALAKTDGAAIAGCLFRSCPCVAATPHRLYMPRLAYLFPPLPPRAPHASAHMAAQRRLSGHTSTRPHPPARCLSQAAAGALHRRSDVPRQRGLHPDVH